MNMVYYYSANDMRVNLFYTNIAAKQNRFAFTVSSTDGKDENITSEKVNSIYSQYSSSPNLPPKGHIGYQQYPVSIA